MIPTTLSTEDYKKIKNDVIPVIFKVTDARDDQACINVGNSFSMETEVFHFKTFDYQVLYAGLGQLIAEEKEVDSLEDLGYGLYEDYLEKGHDGKPEVSIFRRAQELLNEVQEVPYGVLYKFDGIKYHYSGFSYAFFHALYPSRSNSYEAYSTYE